MISLNLQEAAQLLGGELVGGDARFHGVGSDSRRVPAGALFIALRGARFDGHDFIADAERQGAAGALVSRPLNTALPQIHVADTRLALGQLAAAWRRRFRQPVVALTGSNGKTTVKEMIAAILRQRGRVLATLGNLNNDFGVPLTLLRLADEDYAVIEMGASHVGEIAYLTGLVQPDVGLITNAGPAHLEGFGGLTGVARGKGEIYEGLGPHGVAILNREDRYANYWRSRIEGRRTIDFALEQPAQVRGEPLDTAGNRFRLHAAGSCVDIALPLAGVHNLRNALAAAAAALAVGATLDDIRQGLESMQAVAGRLQTLVSGNGSRVIHDAYNANPASLAAALTTVGRSAAVKWLILGDMLELGEAAAELHAEGGRQARAAGFQHCFAIGEHSRQTVLAFGDGGEHFDTIEVLIEALQAALATASEPPTLLIKGSRGMRMERVVEALGAVPASAAGGVPPC